MRTPPAVQIHLRQLALTCSAFLLVSFADARACVTANVRPRRCCCCCCSWVAAAPADMSEYAGTFWMNHRWRFFFFLNLWFYCTTQSIWNSNSELLSHHEVELSTSCLSRLFNSMWWPIRRNLELKLSRLKESYNVLNMDVTWKEVLNSETQILHQQHRTYTSVQSERYVTTHMLNICLTSCCNCV